METLGFSVAWCEKLPRNVCCGDLRRHNLEPRGWGGEVGWGSQLCLCWGGGALGEEGGVGGGGGG